MPLEVRDRKWVERTMYRQAQPTHLTSSILPTSTKWAFAWHLSKLTFVPVHQIRLVFKKIKGNKTLKECNSSLKGEEVLGIKSTLMHGWFSAHLIYLSIHSSDIYQKSTYSWTLTQVCLTTEHQIWKLYIILPFMNKRWFIIIKREINMNHTIQMQGIL